MVYFAQASLSGHIKIGTSTNPNARVVSLESEVGQRVNILAVIFGGESVEQQLHNKFRKSRFYKEWFTPTSDLVAFIADIPKQIVIKDGRLRLVSASRSAPPAEDKGE